MKAWINLSGIILLLTGLPVIADLQTLSCLQSPARVDACPNMIYRSVIEPTTEQKRVICFCKSDFDKLFNQNVTPQQAAYNKMELTQILAEQKLTKAQLLKMISR